MRYVMIPLASLLLSVSSHSVLAETIACQFDKICELGKRCKPADYDVQFIKHEDSDTYAVVADASVEAIGLYAVHDGRQGTLVARNTSAIATHEGIYVLSYAPTGDAILTVTGVAYDNVPYTGSYTGQCEVEK